ncbi:hypothetical protein [Intestinimonas massiliensis (ex Afouda et al. 2020)]|uniref:hypothetical protein n=1 Tax=Intestinimonas massiliensis (ex Afouda et al. 2020) TaxID=1673721 RepID=UPI0012B5B5A5|nr:hypothetical protein [Intestinimonas massiliensis (ex Afouda et al. 2020)]MBS6281524.1 hypothetical protein [Oscillospiraceae bacterium]
MPEIYLILAHVNGLIVLTISKKAPKARGRAVNTKNGRFRWVAVERRCWYNPFLERKKGPAPVIFQSAASFLLYHPVESISLIQNKRPNAFIKEEELP